MGPKGFRIAQYDVDLRYLEDCLVRMLHLTRDAFVTACIALSSRDLEAAATVAHGDNIIDALEAEINKAASHLIMRYQPIATDLRRILAAIRVAADLERIGDTAEGIAKRVIVLDHDHFMPVRRISVLAELVAARFNRLVDAYESKSAANALDIRSLDVEIDAVYIACFSELLQMMEADPSFVRHGAQYLSIAKSFERVGDRLTNVAEQILFELDGLSKLDERPRATVV
jgi:phosphate transport system protein